MTDSSPPKIGFGLYLNSSADSDVMTYRSGERGQLCTVGFMHNITDITIMRGSTYVYWDSIDSAYHSIEYLTVCVHLGIHRHFTAPCVFDDADVVALYWQALDVWQTWREKRGLPSGDSSSPH